MSKLFFIFCLLTISTVSKSQIKALTENGKEVLLSENGTWKYSQDNTNDIISPLEPLKTNERQFSKANSASFLVKSNVFNAGVFINPEKWTFLSHKDNEKNPEYRFSLKSGEGYCMMVTEKTPIDLENMRQIAFINAQKASVDVKETRAEYRVVNNKKILCLELQGTIQGIKFVYFGYYFSNSNGTVQLISYSSQQFFNDIQKDLEVFLNGLVEIN